MPSEKNNSANRPQKSEIEKSEHIASEQIERYSHMESNAEKAFDTDKMQGKPSAENKGGK